MSFQWHSGIIIGHDYRVGYPDDLEDCLKIDDFNRTEIILDDEEKTKKALFHFFL